MDFLTLFITLRCTQECAHCLYGCSPTTGDHMSWEVFTRALGIAKENHIPKLNFFGGEPFLNPQVLPMMQTTFENGLSLILATNCRVLSKEKSFIEYIDVTRQYKKQILVVTARDKFHLLYFDPIAVVNRLRSEGYNVVVQDYSDHTVALSEYNRSKHELQELNTDWCCCERGWTDYVGVLPGGGWTICPPSLEAIGNIFSHSLGEILEFKRKLSFNYDQGCSECLKDFKEFRKAFEVSKV